MSQSQNLFQERGAQPTVPLSSPERGPGGVADVTAHSFRVNGPYPSLGGLLIVRRLAWLGLLGAEFLSLTLRYDTESVSAGRTWGAGVLQHAGLVPRIMIAVGVVMTILGAFRAKTRPRADRELPRRAAPIWPIVVAQLGRLCRLLLADRTGH